jgi:hypothetical protein
LSLRLESSPSLAFKAFALQIVFNLKRIDHTDPTILTRSPRVFLRTVVIQPDFVGGVCIKLQIDDISRRQGLADCGLEDSA